MTMNGTGSKKQTADPQFFRLLIVLIAVFIFCSIVKTDLFFTAANFESMCKQFPEYGLLAIGISLALLTGGIDLSVVNIANLSAVITAVFLLRAAPEGAEPESTYGYIFAGMAICVVTGLFSGMFNGFLISKLGIPAILATLGTSQLYMGFAIVITDGKAISGLPAMLSKMINTSLGGVVPVVLIIFIACAVSVGIFLTKTKTGARVRLLGTNPVATRFVGINNDRLLILVYTLSGLLAAIAGIIMMGRSNSVKADYGTSYTMQCVLIAVLWGVSPNGGKGSIRGVVAAIIVLQMLSSFLNMFENVSNFYRDMLWGGLLVAVMILNYYVEKRELNKLKGV